MYRLTFVLFAVTVFALTGCQREPVGQDRSNDALIMEVPLDPTTLSPSPLYEPKTEEEKAAARAAGEAAAAAKQAEEEAALSWAKENCRLEVFKAPTHFELTSDAAICLVRVKGDCPHGVTVAIDGQLLPSITLSGMTQVFFSHKGATSVTVSPDGDMGQITAIEVWTLNASPPR